MQLHLFLWFRLWSYPFHQSSMFDSILFYFNRNKNQISILRMLYLPFTRIWVRIVFYFIILEGKKNFQQEQSRFFAYLSIDDQFLMIFVDNLITHECDLSLGFQSSSDIHTSAFIFRYLAGGMVPSSGRRVSLRRYQHWRRGGSGGGGPQSTL